MSKDDIEAMALLGHEDCCEWWLECDLEKSAYECRVRWHSDKPTEPGKFGGSCRGAFEGYGHSIAEAIRMAVVAAKAECDG